ncbi:MAG: T9SS type A sorting domain-containing protein, partial [Ginsengibacter sp.]
DTKFSYSSVKIIEFKNITSVKIFPNPASNVLHLRINLSVQNAHLKIINAKGQLVKELTVTSGNSTIPIRNLSSGIYLGDISGNDGTIKFHFVKQ